MLAQPRVRGLSRCAAVGTVHRHLSLLFGLSNGAAMPKERTSTRKKRRGAESALSTRKSEEAACTHRSDAHGA